MPLNEPTANYKMSCNIYDRPIEEKEETELFSIKGFDNFVSH